MLSFSLLIIAAVIIHSCHKDNKQVSPSTTDITIAQAKAWYESAYPVSTVTTSHQTTNSIGNTLFDFSQHIKPNWKHNASYTRFGKNVIEMPMDSSAQFNFNLKNESASVAYYDKKYTRTYFLMMNDGKNYEAYVMMIIADPAYVKNDSSKLTHNTYRKYDADFSGVVLYFTPKGEYLNGYAYQNGQLLGASATGTQSIQSTTDPKLETNLSAPVKCTDWYLITYDKETGDIVDMQYMYTVCTTDSGNGGGSSAPPAPNCTPTTTPPPTVQSTGHLTINVAAPPPGGGFPPPANCPVVAPADTTKNPCQQLAQLNAALANAILAKQNTALTNALKSSNLENGFDQNLQNWSAGAASTYLTTSVLIASPATPDQLNPPFTWNSTNGYTIGFTHDHPNGSGPSPEDIFSMLINSKSFTLTSAGQQAVGFYKTNASVTVVTADNNYVVTINDWSAVQSLYSAYQANPTAFDNAVINNTKSSNYESAILTAFNGAINLYTNNGTPTSYYPLTLNSSKQVSEVPCP